MPDAGAPVFMSKHIHSAIINLLEPHAPRCQTHNVLTCWRPPSPSTGTTTAQETLLRPPNLPRAQSQLLSPCRLSRAKMVSHFRPRIWSAFLVPCKGLFSFFSERALVGPRCWPENAPSILAQNPARKLFPLRAIFVPGQS